MTLLDELARIGWIDDPEKNADAQTGITMTDTKAAPLLPPEEERRLFGLPELDEDVIRHCTLDADDLARIARHRRPGNRLGFAVQLCCLRHPGRLIGRGEIPPEPMLRFLAEQIGTTAEDFADYGRRDKTRLRHAAEIMSELAVSKATATERGSCRVWLRQRALEITDAVALAEAYLAEHRGRCLVIPSRTRAEADCRRALADARQEIWGRLTTGLSSKDIAALEALLRWQPEERVSTLAWLRRAPQAARLGQMLGVFERLERVRAVGVDRNRKALVPRPRFDALVEEARRVPVQHLQTRYGKRRRLATLIAAVIDIEQALLDHGVDLMGRFLSNLFNRTEQVHAEGVQSKGKMIDGQLRTHVDLVDVLAEAKETSANAIELIGERLGWERIIDSAVEARRLIAGEAFNPLSELPEKFTSFKGAAAPFLKTYGFQGAPTAAPLLRAIGMIRAAWESRVSDLPTKLPTGFVSRKWSRFVFTANGSIDRKYYEFCAFDALFVRLRAGDVWIEGARRYTPFEEGLIAPDIWACLCAEGRHSLAVEVDFDAFLTRVRTQMHERLAHVDRLAAAGKLRDAVIDATGLRIGRIEGLQEAKDAEPFARRLYGAMPTVRITELLLEVDRWTGYTQSFSHLRSGRPPPETQALLSVLLADGTNMSLTRMAEASQGFSVRQLAWTADWHVRAETYSHALAKIVNMQHRHPLAARFGETIVSSSDGQHFRAGGPAEARSVVNAKYGREPGAAFYTHISGHYGPFHSTLIPASAGEAPYVLGGVLNHDCDIVTDTHHTDTGGASDHVFGLTSLLGYRFAPRIRNLRQRRLHIVGPASGYPALAPIIEGRINVRLLRDAWSDLLRFAASVQNGAIPAPMALKRLAAYPEQNRIAGALREYGRIVRTLFMLDWIESPDLRRQVTEELNKGEGRNNLARAVFHHRLGELRDRSAEAQANRASGLNLLTSAIILWNTVYLERAIAAPARRRQPIPDHLIRHIAPLGWEHIILTGDYIWSFEPPETPDGYRQLRDPDVNLLAA